MNSAAGKMKCPLCREAHGPLSFNLHIQFDLKQINKIREDHPQWSDKEGMCYLCANLYRRAWGLPPLSKREFYSRVRDAINK